MSSRKKTSRRFVTDSSRATLLYECYVCIVLFGLANGAKVSLVSGTYLSHLV